MKTILTVLAFLAVSTMVNARPLFLDLDPDVPNRRPSDYGFTITSNEDSDHTVFTITLDPRADAAFQKARILILGDLKKEAIPKITVSENEKTKNIQIRVLTKAASDYALRVESLPIANTNTPTENFFGYNLKLKK